MKIQHRASQAINTIDNQLITLTHELKEGLKFVPPLNACTADLLTANDLTTGSSKSLLLNGEVLVAGLNPGISVGGHSLAPDLSISFGSRAFDLSFRKSKINLKETLFSRFGVVSFRCRQKEQAICWDI